MKYGLPATDIRSSLPNGEEAFFLIGIEQLTARVRKGAALSSHAHEMAWKLIHRVEALREALEMREEVAGLIEKDEK